MKIVFDLTEREEEEILKNKFKEHNIFVLGTPLTEKNSENLAEVEILSTFLNPLNKDVLDKMPNLKMISTRSTGTDHIDLEEAKKRGIVVSNVPTYGARTVAEFAFGLILALSRKAYMAYDDLREKGEANKLDKKYEGFDLNGKTIGVVGTGNIGANTLRIAKGFNMRLLANDIEPNEDLIKETGCEYKDLENLVKESDIISIHVPYLETTHHLINKEILNNFKKGSILINTSRGAVVDTEALLWALKDGTLAAAGLDVIEGEKEIQDEVALLKDHPENTELIKDVVAANALIDMPNVVVTPHIAFNTVDAKKEIFDTTLSNIESFIKGDPQNTI